jgi:GNAT superfamily N-acetyltransferase
MDIRLSTSADIPSIVLLLKQSLGEELMPKSEAFWNWKHVSNPFGTSPVLLAFEKDELIGVRAFMSWRWRKGNAVFRAVRAVDTATHPAHQGKGIFKKLTLQLVNHCKEDGVDFIFNTPNASSKPGYLKMGWDTAGKLPITFLPLLNFSKKTENFDQYFKWNSKMVKHFVPADMNEDMLRTDFSEAYLQWRYGENPNISYYAIHDETDGKAYLIIFRLKPYRFGVECRICDYFIPAADHVKKAKSHLIAVAKQSGANLVTFSAPGNYKLSAMPPFAVGPEVTIRPLGGRDTDLSFANWKPSLGDMEVF